MQKRAVKKRKLNHDSSVDSDSSDRDLRFANSTNGSTESEEEQTSGAESSSGDEAQAYLGTDSGDNGDDGELDGDTTQEDPEEAEDNAVGHTHNESAHRSRKPGAANGIGGRSTLQQDSVYTGEIYKSNMFKLQVDQLVKQVRPRYRRIEAEIGDALRTVKAIIEQIPAQDPMSIPDAERALIKQAKIIVPFPRPRPPKNANYKMQYIKPSSINVVGSYQLKSTTITSEPLAVDLLVTVPTSLFQEKDYLNYRYFYKRAFYLACIAAGIKQAEGNRFNICFDTLNGNQLQPIIVVDPSKDATPDRSSASNFRIHVTLGIPDGVFSTAKTSPGSNCVRPKGSDSSTSSRLLPPTPFYNASIRMDALMTTYLKLFYNTSAQCEGFNEACVLGRIWLRQRGFGSHIRKGGFGNFEWAALMATLLLPGPNLASSVLSPGYSSYQLFKATLQFISSRNLCKNPFATDGGESSHSKHDDTPVFFDTARSINILFKMTPWSYNLLQQEAQITIKMLGESLTDHFDAAFNTRTDHRLYRFDATVAVPITAFGHSLPEEDFDLKVDASMRKLYSILCRGLADRVSMIHITQPSTKGWGMNTPMPAIATSGEILIGFVVDANHVDRVIERGPSVENKKDAEAFRQFWGEKAQLKRFNDGSILESIEWSKKDSGPPVFAQIISHLLLRHFGKAVADNTKFFDGQFARILGGDNAVSAFRAMMDCFRELEKDLRSLDGLPLHLRHVLAADSLLSYTSIDVPLQKIPGGMSRPAEVVIEFEGSARWPDDLVAIQKTKIGFLLKIAELLEVTVEGTQTRLGLENGDQELMNQAFLDISRPLAACFRIRIRLDREEGMLNQKLQNKLLDSAIKETAALALAAYKRTLVRIPAHVQALQILSTRFPALSPTIRLMKKWFSAHYLAPHIQEPVVELLVARTFLQPYPWNTPSSPFTGFLRALFSLSRWDWRNEPLIVDLSNGDLKVGDLGTITTRFEAWRKLDPAMNRVVLFVASNLDFDGTTWTDHATPSKVVAGRMTALARAACEEVIFQSLRLVPESLFASSLEDYDFLIHIHPSFSRAALEKKQPLASDAQFKNLQIQSASTSQKDMEQLGYDPVSLFYRDLVRTYGHCAVFFYDGLKASVIAGLWNPVTTTRRSWRAKIGYSTVPLALGTSQGAEEEERLEVKLNQHAVLAEIARIGGDMVRKVEAIAH